MQFPRDPPRISSKCVMSCHFNPLSIGINANAVSNDLSPCAVDVVWSRSSLGMRHGATVAVAYLSGEDTRFYRSLQVMLVARNSMIDRVFVCCLWEWFRTLHPVRETGQGCMVCTLFCTKIVTRSIFLSFYKDCRAWTILPRFLPVTRAKTYMKLFGRVSPVPGRLTSDFFFLFFFLFLHVSCPLDAFCFMPNIKSAEVTTYIYHQEECKVIGSAFPGQA